MLWAGYSTWYPQYLMQFLRKTGKTGSFFRTGKQIKRHLDTCPGSAGSRVMLCIVQAYDLVLSRDVSTIFVISVFCPETSRDSLLETNQVCIIRTFHTYSQIHLNTAFLLDDNDCAHLLPSSHCPVLENSLLCFYKTR